MANPGMMTFDPTKTTQLTGTGQPGQMTGGCPCCAGGPGAPQGLDLQQLIQNPNFIKALLDLAQKMQTQVQPGQQPGQPGFGQPDQTQVPETMMV